MASLFPDWVTMTCSTLLSEDIAWVRRHLPHQGPLQYFVHHNPLEAFTSYPFAEACTIASQLYHGQCFLSQSDYLHHLQAQRIHPRALQQVIQTAFPQASPNAQQAIFAFLNDPPRLKNPAALHKALQQQQTQIPALRQWLPWLADQVPALPTPWKTYVFPTHGALLQKHHGIHLDDILHPLLAKLFSTYSDPGNAYWRNEKAAQGLWTTFCALYQQGFCLENRWAQAIHEHLQRSPSFASHPEAIVAYLKALGVPVHSYRPYLLNLCLRIKGWASLFHTLETYPEQKLDTTPYDFAAFLRVLLCCEAVIVPQVMPATETLSLEAYAREHEAEAQAHYTLEYQWSALHYVLHHSGPEPLPWQAPEIFQYLPQLHDDARRLLYQQALEVTYTTRTLHTLQNHTAPPSPLAQVQYITCLDDREESLRRHLEQQAPHCQTFGVAGHFEMNMHFQGFEEIRSRRLCPGHESTFQVTQVVTEEADVKDRWRQRYARLYRFFTWHSRVSLLAWILTPLTGFWAIFPMLLKLFFPATDLRWREAIHQVFSPDPRRLQDRVFHDEGNPAGLSHAEAAEKVARLLKSIGLPPHFAPLVCVVGHGSSSLNNPHEYGYNCGACGGGKGEANARVFAKIANDPIVRELLAQHHQLQIPAETRFVAGYHDTCRDTLLWQAEGLSPTQENIFTDFQRQAERALEHNILERSQAFHNLPTRLSRAQRIQQVRVRANALREARPEYNHATNALCIIGRRQLTRGLSLQREAFLCSYDPHQDPDGHILSRLFAAVVPVCLGINLEYYFSTTDNEIFGSSSKLNHNLVSYYGVMSGFASDIRLGLSRQMVEIHIPKRMLFLVEQSPQCCEQILQANPSLYTLFYHHWAFLYLWHNSQYYRFEQGQFLCFSLPETVQS